MKRQVMLVATLIAMMVMAGRPGAQVAKGLIDPNVATEQELTALPHITPAIAKELMGRRPFANAIELHQFLTSKSLSAQQITDLYGKAFIHINLNTASADEIMLIPGAGKRMAHEFEEYRPWKAWAQFDKEIGKYVDAKEVARLKQYTFIPLNLNTASEADFMTIPGVGKRMAHEFEEYRPWKTQAQFEKEIGKYVNAKEVARLWRYVVIP
jgi:DNA uptake protein ComE-like DNA-binding protein